MCRTVITDKQGVNQSGRKFDLVGRGAIKEWANKNKIPILEFATEESCLGVSDNSLFKQYSCNKIIRHVAGNGNYILCCKNQITLESILTDTILNGIQPFIYEKKERLAINSIDYKLQDELGEAIVFKLNKLTSYFSHEIDYWVEHLDSSLVEHFGTSNTKMTDNLWKKADMLNVKRMELMTKIPL